MSGLSGGRAGFEGIPRLNANRKRGGVRTCSHHEHHAANWQLVVWGRRLYERKQSIGRVKLWAGNVR